MQESRLSRVYKCLSVGFFLFFCGFVTNAVGHDWLDQEDKNLRTHQISVVNNQGDIDRELDKTADQAEDRTRAAHIYNRSSPPPMFKDRDEFLNFLKFGMPLYVLFALQLSNIHDDLSSFQVLTGLFLGFFMADFLSGLVHICTDTLDPRVFGKIFPRVIAEPITELFKGAQDHHKDPLDVYNQSIWENNRKYHALAFVGFPAAHLFARSGYPLTSEITCVVSLLSMWTGLCHLIGHGAYHNHPLVGRLKRMGLLITEDSHHKHHANPKHDESFCIISGRFLNPFVDWLYKRGDAFLKELSTLRKPHRESKRLAIR
jgi:hypothetical protein